MPPRNAPQVEEGGGGVRRRRGEWRTRDKSREFYVKAWRSRVSVRDEVVGVGWGGEGGKGGVRRIR